METNVLDWLEVPAAVFRIHPIHTPQPVRTNPLFSMRTVR